MNFCIAETACSLNSDGFFINEFPDYPADLIEKKANLVVRLGKKRAPCIYIAMAIASLCTYPLPLLQGIPPMTYLWSFPVVFAIVLVSVVWVSRRSYQNRVALEKTCPLTLLLNPGISLAISKNRHNEHTGNPV